MSPSRVAVVPVLVSLLLAPPSVHAWGSSGHRIVAKVAAKNLSQDARKKLRRIFSVSDAGLEAAMARAATWPDLIDKKATHTGDWHFIDVPVFSPFSTTGLCPDDNCVINRIEEMERRLRTSASDFELNGPVKPERGMTSQEVAFLIHFIGDVHQPLHAAVNGDRGGNCVHLTNPLRHDPFDTTEVHAVWDTDEVLTVMKKHNDSEDETANALFQKFKDGTAVSQATPTDWAHESNDLARTAVYQKLHIAKHTAPPGTCAARIKRVTVTDEYLNDNVPDVEQRLMFAGIRLSNVLNDICKGAGCKASP